MKEHSALLGCWSHLWLWLTQSEFLSPLVQEVLLSWSLALGFVLHFPSSQQWTAGCYGLSKQTLEMEPWRKLAKLMAWSRGAEHVCSKGPMKRGRCQPGHSFSSSTCLTSHKLIWEETTLSGHTSQRSASLELFFIRTAHPALSVAFSTCSLATRMNSLRIIAIISSLCPIILSQTSKSSFEDKAKFVIRKREVIF